jgi:hypothetical protein
MGILGVPPPVKQEMRHITNYIIGVTLKLPRKCGKKIGCITAKNINVFSPLMYCLQYSNDFNGIARIFISFLCTFVVSVQIMSCQETRNWTKGDPICNNQ